MSIARRVVSWSMLVLGMQAWSATAQAQPSVKAALSLKPLQADVDYDTPDAKAVEQCKVSVIKVGKATGWLVSGPGGQTLRRFMDLDGVKDAKGETAVDEFSYFKNGLEVYRETDTNGNGKKDQFRWFNFGGSRWGVDTNEDGKIDAWKKISAEEVSHQAVRALVTQDASLIGSLLVTKEDLKQLGIEGSLGERLLASVSDPAGKLKKAVAGSKMIGANTNWMRFDATPTAPRAHSELVIPGESIKASRDVVVYENVMGIVDSGNPAMPGLVMVGELVRVGDVWKMTSLPVPLEGNVQIEPGLLMNEPLLQSGRDSSTPAPTQIPKEVQELLVKYQKLMGERPAPDAAPAVYQKWEKSVEGICVELANAVTSEEDKLQWTRQLLDHISMAVDTGKDPGAVARMRKLETEIIKAFPKAPLVVTARYRVMYAEYLLAMQEAEKDDEAKQKVHDRWLGTLADFLDENPKFEQAADASLQLAQELEFDTKVEKAIKWYQRIVKDFGESPMAPRAAGALKRLNLVGQPLVLAGPGLTGGTVDIRQFKGKVCCVVFWDTFNKQHTENLATLKALYDSHHADGLEILGVNLDVDKTAIAPYLQKYAIKWPQIFVPGGQDSPVAIEFGIFAVPTMMLVDKEGKVVSRAATLADLKSSIPELLGKK